MHPVPPELQWLAFVIPEDDFGPSEDGNLVGTDVLGEEDVAAAIRATVLRPDAEQQIERAVPVPVDDVDLRAATTVTPSLGVDAVGLDRLAVLVAQLFSGVEEGRFVRADPSEDGEIEVLVLDDDVGEAAAGEVADARLLPPRAAQRFTVDDVQTLRGAEFGFGLGSPVRVPVVEPDHVADEQVEEAVAVPVHEHGVAVAARVAVVWAL